MMGSATHKASTNGNNRDRNSLTNIKGIGAIRKQWLNSLGIYTIADLAQASAIDIESQLKSDGRPTSKDELEEWIAQAHLYLAKHSLHPAEPFSDKPSNHGLLNTTLVSQAFDNAEEASGAIALNHLSENPLNPEFENLPVEWKSVASFKIEYQTRQVEGAAEQQTVVHDLESGAIETWLDFENQSIRQWMLDRVEANLPQPQIVHPVVPEVVQLQLLQPPQMGLPMIADKTHPFFPDAVRSDASFALEVSLQFTDLTDINLGKQMVYQMQCIARNLATGMTVSLGDATTNVLLSNESIYTVLLPKLMLPDPGIYRFKVLINLKNASAASSYFKIPLLQVV